MLTTSPRSYRDQEGARGRCHSRSVDVHHHPKLGGYGAGERIGPEMAVGTQRQTPTLHYLQPRWSNSQKTQGQAKGAEKPTHKKVIAVMSPNSVGIVPCRLFWSSLLRQHRPGTAPGFSEPPGSFPGSDGSRGRETQHTTSHALSFTTGMERWRGSGRVHSQACHRCQQPDGSRYRPRHSNVPQVSATRLIPSPSAPHVDEWFGPRKAESVSGGLQIQAACRCGDARLVLGVVRQKDAPHGRQRQQ